MLDLVQDDLQHDHIPNGGILQVIDFVEEDVRVRHEAVRVRAEVRVHASMHGLGPLPVPSLFRNRNRTISYNFVLIVKFIFFNERLLSKQHDPYLSYACSIYNLCTGTQYSTSATNFLLRGWPLHWPSQSDVVLAKRTSQ